jgi:hypothetical protein
MPMSLTFQGACLPFLRRSSARSESVGEVMYSSHSIISRGVPLPTFTLT